MKVLWVKSELLHPIDKGGKIRTFEMLRHLMRGHEVVNAANIAEGRVENPIVEAGKPPARLGG